MRPSSRPADGAERPSSPPPPPAQICRSHGGTACSTQKERDPEAVGCVDPYVSSSRCCRSGRISVLYVPLARVHPCGGRGDLSGPMQFMNERWQGKGFPKKWSKWIEQDGSLYVSATEGLGGMSRKLPGRVDRQGQQHPVHDYRSGTVERERSPGFLTRIPCTTGTWMVVGSLTALF